MLERVGMDEWMDGRKIARGRLNGCCYIRVVLLYVLRYYLSLLFPEDEMDIVCRHFVGQVLLFYIRELFGGFVWW